MSIMLHKQSVIPSPILIEKVSLINNKTKKKLIKDVRPLHLYLLSLLHQTPKSSEYILDKKCIRL